VEDSYESVILMIMLKKSLILCDCFSMYSVKKLMVLMAPISVIKTSL
jgi:hypothetical protein